MTNTPRGGSRNGAGRRPKSGDRRIQRSVNLTPAAWAVIHAARLPGESDSDAFERLLTAPRSAAGVPHTPAGSSSR